MAHILIIEDESELVDIWTYYLEQAGHRITSTTEGAEGLDMAQDFNPDLIILDLRLRHSAGRRQVTGTDILRTVRTESGVPIIITTGNFTEPVDRVLGFQQGADDYLIKGNFSVQELLARVEYQLARGHRHTPAQADIHTLSSGNLVLDRNRQTVTMDAQPLDLTPLEFKILVFFMLHQGRNVSHEEIWNHCWQDPHADSLTIRNNIRIQISGLRRKMGDSTAREPRIVSIRGVGYSFRG